MYYKIIMWHMTSSSIHQIRYAQVSVCFFFHIYRRNHLDCDKMRCSLVVNNYYDCLPMYSPVGVIMPFHMSITCFDLNRLSIFVLYFRLLSSSCLLSFKNYFLLG